MKTYTQKYILELFKDFDEVLKKSEIKERGNIRYYHNTDKHLGDMLHRMVKNKSLERVKHGHYKKAYRSPEPIPGQTDLFNSLDYLLKA